MSTKRQLPKGTIALYACQSREKEPEYEVAGRHYGLLTWFVSHVVNERRTVSDLSYQQLADAVVSRYRRDRYSPRPSRSPRVEGSAEAIVCGAGKNADLPPYWKVLKQGENRDMALITAGAVHGVTKGLLYELYETPEQIGNPDAESISCNNCGAPLQVPESANYVTCNHFGSQLAVKRDEHVTYTEKIKEIDQRTVQMQVELQSLRIDNELAKLDRQWDLEKENYMIKDNEGHKKIPTTSGSVVGGIVIAVFGIFWTGFAASMSSGSSHPGGGGMFSCFPMFGVLFIIIGIGIGIYSYGRAKDYLDAERRYRQRRSELMEKKHKRE